MINDRSHDLAAFGIRMDGVGKQFSLASQGRVQVNYGGIDIASDLTDERDDLVVDCLVVDAPASGKTRRWQTYKDFDLGIDLAKGGDHRLVVGQKLGLVPPVFRGVVGVQAAIAAMFAVIGAEHNDDNVRPKIKGVCVLTTEHIGQIAVLQHGCTATAKVTGVVIRT